MLLETCVYHYLLPRKATLISQPYMSEEDFAFTKKITFHVTMKYFKMTAIKI